MSSCSRTGSDSNSEPVPVPTRNLAKGSDFEGKKKLPVPVLASKVGRTVGVLVSRLSDDDDVEVKDSK